MNFDNQLQSFAHKLADVSGEIARRYWRMPLWSEQKIDLSPVTVADKQIETAIRELIEAQYPEHGIIGEEHGNVRPESDYQWVIDPIDGTRSFIAGMLTFTTLIALTYKSEPVLGVINQPITNERWFGGKGHASTCNGNKIIARKTADLAQATVATTSTYYFSDAEKTAFENLRKQCANVFLGGDAYSYALVAHGQLDLVVDCGMKTYDFCALKPVIEGAGGIITDWNGKPLSLYSDGRILAASNAELHAKALSVLQAA